MRTRPALCFILGLGCFSAAQADIIGVKGSVDYWKYNSDLSSALGQPEMKDDASLSFALAVEHPVPLLPNVKIKHSTLEAESEREVLNEKMVGLATNFSEQYSDKIIRYISERIHEWDSREMIAKIESEVGGDLHMIRVNGVIVGAFIGLALGVIRAIVENVL